jgi:hypothetical protein
VQKLVNEKWSVSAAWWFINGPEDSTWHRGNPQGSSCAWTIQIDFGQTEALAQALQVMEAYIWASGTNVSSFGFLGAT